MPNWHCSHFILGSLKYSCTQRTCWWWGTRSARWEPGRAATLGLGTGTGTSHTKLHVVSAVCSLPMVWLGEGLSERRMKWWSNEWALSIIHELKQTFVPDKITHWISLQWTIARLHRARSISLHTVWMGAAPAFLTLFWNNTLIFLLVASRQFGLQSPINPYFFF